MNHPQWPQTGDLVLIDKEEIGMVIDIKSAKEVYTDMYDTDDEGGHIWLGGDNVIHHMNMMGQVLINSRCEWIRVERLSVINE